ncbi:MAG: hypothetical protein JKY96_02385 [Phycisphaerales bacterium]|nr:hypothetical protein [Phycisphaerales bacterium]
MPYFPSILKDPQLGISSKDQNLLLGEASSAWSKQRLNKVINGASFVAMASILAIATVLIKLGGLSSMPYTLVLWTVVFPLLLVGWHYLIFHIGFRPHLYRVLREAGHDICPKCGYILFTLPTSETKCPECGTQRSPLDTAAETQTE